MTVAAVDPDEPVGAPRRVTPPGIPCRPRETSCRQSLGAEVDSQHQQPQRACAHARHFSPAAKQPPPISSSSSIPDYWSGSPPLRPFATPSKRSHRPLSNLVPDRVFVPVESKPSWPPCSSPPPLEQSAQQPRNVEIAAALNASQHLDEKPPPAKQPGARQSLPPCGVAAVLAPLFPEPPPEESADSSQELEFAAIRDAATVPRPSGFSSAPTQEAAGTGTPAREVPSASAHPLQEPPSIEIVSGPPPSANSAIQTAAAAESYGTTPPPPAEGEESDVLQVDSALSRLFAEYSSGDPPPITVTTGKQLETGNPKAERGGIQSPSAQAT
nr:fibrous sheath CABYR-binding protein-like [Drosophila kikkawai]